MNELITHYINNHINKLYYFYITDIVENLHTAREVRYVANMSSYVAVPQVSNCTVHGGWTSWSAWSQCSATCGVAVKSRRRSCTNPAPQHGGRVCVGVDHNEIYCHLLPPCPGKLNLGNIYLIASSEQRVSFK